LASRAVGLLAYTLFRSQYLPRNGEPAALSHTIDPMLSLRTSFEGILSDLQKRHKAYVETMETDDPQRSCLALKFPAFTCEVKLDGERLLAHLQKGVVKLQVRLCRYPFYVLV